MKRLLFVSVSFPPKADSEALQVAKYFHYLQRHGDLKIDVVTSKIPTLYMPYDKDLEPYASGADQLISVPLKENRYINYLRNKLGLGETVFPDVKESFHLQANQVLKKLKHKPDLIYSRADPLSSAIMGYKLKKALQVPWIMHLSDPWADCPLKNMSRSYYERNNKWEYECFKEADIITLTALKQIQFYKEKYPEFADKLRFYPNVYERLSSGDGNTQNEPDHSKLRIVYTGGLAYPRTVEPFLKALSGLRNRGDRDLSKLEVVFAGPVDSFNRGIFKKFALPFVKWLGNVSFQEIVRVQQSAHYLLCIDFPIFDPSKAMFFLSKLLGYMVVEKRILALTTKGSEVDRVVDEVQGDACDQRDLFAIQQCILNALDAFEAGNFEYFKAAPPPQIYEAIYNADRLYKEISELTR